jgi:uncharacterized integral membrane protein
MIYMIKVLHWVLGILAALSLALSVIFKLIYNFARVIVFTTTPRALLLFAATCCLASIALSMIELSCKAKAAPETPAAKPEGESAGGGEV